MSVLLKIVEKKRERIDASKRRVPLRELKSRIGDVEKARDFASAVKRDSRPIRLVAEVKKGSPSRGIIREDFDPAAVARIYEDKAVDAVSVITEEDFFSGSLDHIQKVRDVLSRPVLRKDFIIDDYQIFEARAFGADAILLIAGLLGEAQAGEYIHAASELGMAVLFEVHDHIELQKALLVEAPIIGVNNRDLRSLDIDLNTTLRLRSEIPAGKTIVSESGIRTRADVLRLEEAGVDAMLIGTSLMESGDPGAKIDELRGITQ